MTRYSFTTSTRAGEGKIRLRRGDPSRHWVVVLAGGNGSRLGALTSDGMGWSVPKQYCSLFGGRSLLGDALVRAERLTDRSRVLTVVASQHEPFWRRDLGGRETGNLIAQPRDRGTAAGILLPLLSILDRDPDAHVTVMPSDHYVADEDGLARSVRSAQSVADASPERVILVGIDPDRPETDYGWILPGQRDGGAWRVTRFVEKPSRKEAVELMRRGAVWNAFLMTGAARAVLQLYVERLPQLLAAFRGADVTVAKDCLAQLYETLPSVDFCRDLLAGAETRLGLVVARRCGWTDLGTPARVARCAEANDHPVPAGDSLVAAALRAGSPEVG